MSAPVRSPGWYLDPQNPVQYRWWNGVGWSESVRPVQTASDRLDEAYDDEDSIFYDARDGDPAYIREAWVAPTRGAFTFPILLLAISPLWLNLLVEFAIGWQVNTNSGLFSTIGAAHLLLILYALTALDAKRLRARGFRTASPLWGLLLPVYFVLRTKLLGRAGALIFIVYATLFLLAVAVGVGFFSSMGGSSRALGQSDGCGCSTSQQVAGQLPAAAQPQPVAIGPDIPVPPPMGMKLTAKERSHELTSGGLLSTLLMMYKPLTAGRTAEAGCDEWHPEDEGIAVTRCTIGVVAGDFNSPQTRYQIEVRETPDSPVSAFSYHDLGLAPAP